MEINNREIASIFWLTVFLVWAVLFTKNDKDIRASIGYVIKAFFAKTIVITAVIFICYVLSIVYFCYLIGCWDSYLFKDTILWIIVAFSNILKITEKGDFKEKMRAIALRCFTCSFFIEYIANMASFSLIVELIVTPIIAFIVLLSVVAEYDEKNAILRVPLNFLLVSWGIFILLYSAYTILSNENINIPIEAMKFSLPFILTFLFVPFVYTFFLYCQYKRLYTPIYYNVKNKNLAIKILYKIFKKFGLNLFAIEQWQNHVHSFHLKSVDDVEESFRAGR